MQIVALNNNSRRCQCGCKALERPCKAKTCRFTNITLHFCSEKLQKVSVHLSAGGGQAGQGKLSGVAALEESHNLSIK